MALLRFPAQRSPRLPDFKTRRKDVRVASLVLLHPSLGRAGQNCSVDRAVQIGLAAREKTYFSRMAGTADAIERSARSRREAIEAAHCDAVFADERHSLHLARGCRNDRAHSLVWGRTRHKRGTGAAIRSRVLAGTTPDACGSLRQNASDHPGGVC